MKILFIRHGQTKNNAEQRWLGSTDVSLWEEGINALLKNKSIVDKYKPFEKLYSSPMKRCIETAKIYFDDMSYEILNDLRERSFGDFEGMTYNELKDNPYYKEFAKSCWKSEIPNGEISNNFFNRVYNVYLTIIEDMKKNNLKYTAVVTHGGIIMTILDKYNIEKHPFYDYLLPNGCGYLTEIIENNNLKIIDKILL
ncbi:histidine phosphatase family protein [Brachyspira pilosicoli]|uniref:histidine phosphatase family protein n=1 Tax=Brachyspira pilosicoli TaxID=52584 RepID=UPI00300771C7